MRLQAIDPANLSKKRRLARARLSSIVPTLNMAYLTEVAVLLLLLALLLQLLLLMRYVFARRGPEVLVFPRIVHRNGVCDAQGCSLPLLLSIDVQGGAW